MKRSFAVKFYQCFKIMASRIGQLSILYKTGKTQFECKGTCVSNTAECNSDFSNETTGDHQMVIKTSKHQYDDRGAAPDVTVR